MAVVTWLADFWEWSKSAVAGTNVAMLCVSRSWASLVVGIRQMAAKEQRLRSTPVARTVVAAVGVCPTQCRAVADLGADEKGRKEGNEVQTGRTGASAGMHGMLRKQKPQVRGKTKGKARRQSLEAPSQKCKFLQLQDPWSQPQCVAFKGTESPPKFSQPVRYVNVNRRNISWLIILKQTIQIGKTGVFL